MAAAERLSLLMNDHCYLVFLLFLSSFFLSVASNVTYDDRSLIIDGERKLLISAAIHYPRSVPEMWPSLVQKAKKGGVDVIETYVFWNVHEPSSGNYHFEGRFDLVNFVKIVHQAGMYLILRIGPFVAAEWNFGGIPVWLHYVPDTVFRTDNSNFKYYMQRFTTYVVEMMKQQKLFSSQGGPIILAQVENEYGYYEATYGEAGKRYANWAADMALNQTTGVPWIMCQQFEAPKHVINTCNSFYCDDFKPIYADKPKIWTENWPGWFQTFGEPNPHRPLEDVAYSVARFFGKGGSLQNYYMYHGGTNFGRTAGGPFITTSYDYDAPIDEYGMVRYPVWGHLRELHDAIKSCEHAILTSKPMNFSLGPLQEVHVYADAPVACAAFISNSDPENDVTVKFRNTSYYLPAWSVSILPDCKNVMYNTAQVSSQSSIVEMIPTVLQPSKERSNQESGGLKWEIFVERPGVWETADFVKRGLVDHINTTKDTTDYLWYTTSIFVGDDEDFKKGRSQTVFVVESKGHALHAFVNKQLKGSGYGNGTHPSFEFRTPISLKVGQNDIDLLSMTVGQKTAGPYYEWVGAGLTTVKIEGFNNGTLDLSSFNWTYKIGLQGESYQLSQLVGYDNLNWVATSEAPKNQPMTWYKVMVDAPSGTEPIGLDMNYMGKGLAWLNGEEIGRYWPRNSSVNDKCDNKCDYRGKYMPDKCRTGCGAPTQRWYHIPRSWFKPSGNVLVIFEETGGDPSKVVFSRRKVTGLCANVGENYPAIHETSQDSVIRRKASVRLTCPVHSVISKVQFASFGTPEGNCGSYTSGACHDPDSIAVVEKACLNTNECKVEVGGKAFPKNLCPGIIRKLAVEVQCS